jgi:dihydroxyacetone kinase-like predicted kinase
VVGDATALKIHLHTDDPGAALSLGTRAGTVGGVEIANMHAQTEAREERLLRAVPDAEPTACDVVAVVAGDGNARLFTSLGTTRIVEGGQTMNPSTAELVAAVEECPADDVVVLPNNANVVMAAEQAAAAVAGKDVRVVRADTIPAGLAAMVAYDAALDAEANERAMSAAVETVATGEVTVASRDVQLNGVAIRKGSFLGLARGEAVAGGDDFDDVACAVIERLLAEPRDVLTLLTGADEPELESLLERIRSAHPELELEVQDGGQPHYPLLVGAE